MKNDFQKNSLWINGSRIFRVLDLQEDKIFVIDCVKRTMPTWIEKAELEQYHICTEQRLQEETNVPVIDISVLDIESRKTAYERFTMISPILPFISNAVKRKELLSKLTEIKSTTKQTIRYYLCLYLSYQDISVLAPKQSIKQNTLSQDEKNMRWALNKYFYTKNRNSLNTAYTYLLKEKYFQSYMEFIVIAN